MFRFGDPGGRMYAAAGAANANVLAWWTTAVSVSGGTLAVSAGNGRAGGSSLRVTCVNTGFGLGKVLDSQPTWGVALGARYSAVPTGTTQLVQFKDAAAAQVDLRVLPDGTMQATRNGTVLGTTAGVVAAGAYLHVEYKVTFHPSAGTVQLWVNGASKLNLTGQNTRATANSSANEIDVGQPSNSAGTFTLDLDDVIVYDGQATDPNGLADITGPIGDCGLAWLLPTGAGTTTQFTPDTGSNYARVNEATPDGDASYAESATVGQIDTYAMADLPAAASVVKSLAAVHYARKTDAGSRGLKSVLRSAGANATHAAEIALGNSYQYYFSNWGRDPNNGAPQDWTPAAVNALEAGQTVSS